MLTVSNSGPVVRLVLNRPDRRNALSHELVVGLRTEVLKAGTDPGVRVVVLAGEGIAFCAGGDIAEFVSAAKGGTGRRDAEALADLLAAIAGCPKPVVVRVHGAAFGGGFGLVCAADIAVAGSASRFSLSEARLGLVPAVISPYVLRALGPRNALAQMLLAEPFDAAEALRLGLVQRVVEDEALDAAMGEIVDALLRNAPGALAAIKRLPDIVEGEPSRVRTATAALLAERLASDEAQEGLGAFLEKRPAAWVVER